MAKSPNSKLQGIETRSRFIQRIENCEEFVPNLRAFMDSAVQLERRLFWSDSIIERINPGRILVNRIYLASIVTYYIREFRIETGYFTPNDKTFQRMLRNNLNPQGLYFPVHCFNLLMNSIHCYQAFDTSTIHIPMINPHVQVSNPRRHDAINHSYQHVYVPFEYQDLPDLTILTNLLILIRRRKSIFTEKSDTTVLAIKYLLTGNAFGPALHISDQRQTPKEVLTSVTQNIFLHDIPDCTPALFAKSIDDLDPHLIPELEKPEHCFIPSPDNFERILESTPTSKWFTHAAMFQTLVENHPPDLTTVDFLPNATQLGKTLEQRVLTLEISERNLLPEHPNLKSTDFWLAVFTSP